MNDRAIAINPLLRCVAPEEDIVAIGDQPVFEIDPWDEKGVWRQGSKPSVLKKVINQAID